MLRTVTALRLLAVSLALSLGGGPARAFTRHVPADASTIAAGLAASVPGDTVLVSCGTYFENDLALKSGVVLRSAGGTPACCTIDGQFLGRVLEAVAVDSTARLEGFTIRGGDATAGAFFDNGGGGLRTEDSSLRVKDCAFEANRAKFGGAVGCERGSPSFTSCTFDSNQATGTDWAAGGALYSHESAPVLTSCTFVGNDASATTTPGDGGAVFCDTSNLVGTDCHFEGNTADAGAGGLYSYSVDRTALTRCTFFGNSANAGGALYLETSFGAFTDCNFDDNVAANGGAVFIALFGEPHLEGCRFTSNESTPFGGGAIDCFRSKPVLVECTFLGNVAGTVGGAIRFEGSSSATIDRAIIAGNSSALEGGGLHFAGTTSATLSRSTVHGNSGSSGGGVFVAGSASVSISLTIISGSTSGGALACSGSGNANLVGCDLFGNTGGDWMGCIAGQFGTLGNFSADPLYCGAASQDFELTMPGSPCLPGNAPSGVLVGREGVGCGCPAFATKYVPADYPSVAAALAAAIPGDVIGVCSGDWPGTVVVKEGVHVIGARTDLTRLFATSSGEPALVHARGVADSTVYADLTLDAAGTLAHGVLAESTSTGLHLYRTRVTGATSWGIVNGPDSRLRLGGTLDTANDIFANGGAQPRLLLNENTIADSLDAELNFWGTTFYPAILSALQGPIRSCPITDSTHTKSLCAPLSALDAPDPPQRKIQLSAYPNPFTKESTVSFSTSRELTATVRLYDIRGRRVRTLFDGRTGPGLHRIPWNGRDDSGRSAAPGIYFARLELAGTLPTTTRLVLLR